MRFPAFMRHCCRAGPFFRRNERLSLFQAHEDSCQCLLALDLKWIYYFYFLWLEAGEKRTGVVACSLSESGAQ